MATELGTRIKATSSQTHSSSKTISEGFTRDVGLAERVVASLTFTASNGRVTGSNGTFAAFAHGDPITIRGTNLNNGEYQVAGIDATNHAYLVLDWPCKDEGPITCEVRSS